MSASAPPQHLRSLADRRTGRLTCGRTDCSRAASDLYVVLHPVILDMGAAISGLLLHAGDRLGLAGTLAVARPRNHPGRGPAGLRKVIADDQAAAALLTAGRLGDVPARRLEPYVP